MADPRLPCALVGLKRTAPAPQVIRHHKVSRLSQTLLRFGFGMLVWAAAMGFMACSRGAQLAWFADGYHGGIYGHYPPAFTQFIVDALRQHPDWRLNLEIEPETWDFARTNTPEAYQALKALITDPAAPRRVEFVNPAYGQSYLWTHYFESVALPRLAPDWRVSQEDFQVSLVWGAQVLQRIARQVRGAENRLAVAEKLATPASVYRQMPWPAAALDEAWRTLLLAQHHDCWIVPYNGRPGDTWADKVRRWTDATRQTSDEIIDRSTTGAVPAHLARPESVQGRPV